MNKRQHKKIATSLAAKIIAKIKQPNIFIGITKPEIKLWKNEEPFIRYLVIQTALEDNQ
ncbi:hypothetical protein MKY29_12120 [Psychrobacillus sp. FSL K6-2365]|uniref:hypothetical protein n=1 Tax=Psychrobacillus sp. FSL K6-2365 TaxID=2921546 RepID=UPI0030F4B700